eukprot:GILI01012049.1.p1 GENE.GILI01012049.1~~GILI01012049.1.p1  ORF type:complete len:240 (+),score=39.34 GILI01012049.1:75-794(+)
MSFIEEWFKDIPPITRTYMTLSFLTTAACALELVSPLSLYFNFKLIFQKYQIWRLFTNFWFFGLFGLDFLFHLFFLVRYSRLLEENSFRGRTADFVYMLLLGAASMTLVAPFLDINFLGSSLAFMMVYVWARRNPHAQMSFLELFNFTAPYLPWVLLSFSVLLNGSLQSLQMDLLGIIVGHTYYFFEDVYPRLPSGGRRVFKTPRLITALFSSAPHMPNIRVNPDFDAAGAENFDQFQD